MRKMYFQDVIFLALFYRKRYANTGMLSYDKILEYDRAVNKILSDKDIDMRIYFDSYFEPNLFFGETDEYGKEYMILNSSVDFNKLMKKIDSLYFDPDIILALESDTALSILGLKGDDKNNKVLKKLKQ